MAGDIKKSEQEACDKAKEAFEKYATVKYPYGLVVDSISKLQVQIAYWQSENFGVVSMERQALGVAEEAGELCHSILKHLQGIRGYDDENYFRVKAGDAIADATIYLMQVCTVLRLDFATLVRETGANVMGRDWVADKKSGGEE